MTDRHDHAQLEDLAGLEALRDVPPPRRTDAAFAKSVADDVARSRAPRWLFVPALAAGAAAFGFFFATPDAMPDAPDTVAHDAGSKILRPDIVALESAEPVVELDEADPGVFSFPTLDASSEQELLAFERRLDEAMKKHQPL